MDNLSPAALSAGNGMSCGMPAWPVTTEQRDRTANIWRIHPFTARNVYTNKWQQQ